MTDITTPPAPIVVPIYPQLGSLNFNQESYTYGSAMPGVAAAMQALANNTHGNATAAHERAEAAAAAASAASIMAAFKGLWSAQSGQLKRPATVLDNGAYWQLLQDLPDVAAVRPGTDPAVWSPQIMEARDIGAINLNLLINSGSYVVSGAITNGPPGVSGAVMTVTHGGGAAVQELHDTSTGASWVRTVRDMGAVPVWTEWRRITQDNPPFVPLAGGAIDCSKGTNFTETISANRTLEFTNVPAGAYSCVLEVHHTGGTIMLPVGSVWVAATPPILNTPRRHLLFFQRAATGNGGWIVSALPNSAV